VSANGDTQLEIPETPGDVPYRDREDAWAHNLLTLNGRPDDDDAVLELLDSKSELLSGAASRLVGARGLEAGLPRLRELAASPDDLLAVHAAAGLARLDPEAGREELKRVAALPWQGAPGAIQAAGELARLGDPSAAPTVYAALDSDNSVLRSIAAKQLLFLADAGEPQARERIETLQTDADDGLAAIARAQLANL
jgi:HEAT repeat protein